MLKKVTCNIGFCIQGIDPSEMNALSRKEKETKKKKFATSKLLTPVLKEILKAVLPAERKLSQIKDRAGGAPGWLSRLGVQLRLRS